MPPTPQKGTPDKGRSDDTGSSSSRSELFGQLAKAARASVDAARRARESAGPTLQNVLKKPMKKTKLDELISSASEFIGRGQPDEEDERNQRRLKRDKLQRHNDDKKLSGKIVEEDDQRPEQVPSAEHRNTPASGKHDTGSLSEKDHQSTSDPILIPPEEEAEAPREVSEAPNPSETDQQPAAPKASSKPTFDHLAYVADLDARAERQLAQIRADRQRRQEENEKLYYNLSEADPDPVGPESMKYDHYAALKENKKYSVEELRWYHYQQQESIHAKSPSVISLSDDEQQENPELEDQYNALDWFSGFSNNITNGISNMYQNMKSKLNTAMAQPDDDDPHSSTSSSSKTDTSSHEQGDQPGGNPTEEDDVPEEDDPVDFLEWQIKIQDKWYKFPKHASDQAELGFEKCNEDPDENPKWHWIHKDRLITFFLSSSVITFDGIEKTHAIRRITLKSYRAKRTLLFDDYMEIIYEKKNNDKPIKTRKKIKNKTLIQVPTTVYRAPAGAGVHSDNEDPDEDPNTEDKSPSLDDRWPYSKSHYVDINGKRRVSKSFSIEEESSSTEGDTMRSQSKNVTFDETDMDEKQIMLRILQNQNRKDEQIIKMMSGPDQRMTAGGTLIQNHEPLSNSTFLQGEGPTFTAETSSKFDEGQKACKNLQELHRYRRMLKAYFKGSHVAPQGYTSSETIIDNLLELGKSLAKSYFQATTAGGRNQITPKIMKMPTDFVLHQHTEKWLHRVSLAMERKSGDLGAKQFGDILWSEYTHYEKIVGYIFIAHLKLDIHSPKATKSAVRTLEKGPF